MTACTACHFVWCLSACQTNEPSVCLFIWIPLETYVKLAAEPDWGVTNKFGQGSLSFVWLVAVHVNVLLYYCAAPFTVISCDWHKAWPVEIAAWSSDTAWDVAVLQGLVCRYIEQDRSTSAKPSKVLIAWLTNVQHTCQCQYFLSIAFQQKSVLFVAYQCQLQAWLDYSDLC